MFKKVLISIALSIFSVAEAKTHTGSVRVKNEWGQTISEITVRHRRGNDGNKQEMVTFYTIPNGQYGGKMSITYETGAGSPFDYWWVKFLTLGGTTYSVKDDFSCYIAYYDDGNVTLTLQGDNDKMYVSFSDSGSCKVSVDKR